MEQTFEQCLEQLKANQLTELNLAGKNLTGTQVIDLAEVIKHNQTLTTLNLYNNRLGTAMGAESLSEALKVNRTLTSLNLNFGKLAAAEAESLSEALKVNRTLTRFDLYGNQLGAVGAESLSEALKVNQTLTSLNLGNNQLDVAGGESLSAALKVNQTLTMLDIRYNQLEIATVQGINKALQTNIERIKSTRNHTLLTIFILLRHAHSTDSTLPRELWQIIMHQLDFPSVKKGYRTSHAIANFFTQKNIVAEFTQRLQTKQSVRLVETHGAKLSESRFSFLTPQTTLLSDAANPLSPVSVEGVEQQSSFSNTKS